MGSVEDELGAARFEDVRQAIADEFAERYELYEGALPAEVALRALALEAITPWRRARGGHNPVNRATR